jgi:glycosyltransferase involved in cell wall biosynthesis
MRMKLLVLTAAWPSRRAPRVGGFIRNLVRGLDEEGVATRVVAPGARGGAEGARGFPVGAARLKLAAPSLALGVLYLISAARTCIREGRAWGAEALLVNWVLPTGPAALAAVRRLGIPLYVWAHGSDLEVYAQGGRLWRTAARAVLGAARHVFAVSRSLEEKARALGAARVTRLPMGVSDAFKAPGAAAARRGPFTVTFCGDLIASKGLRELCAAKRLLGGGRPARWVCAGDGPLRPMLARAGFEVRPGLAAPEVAGLLDESHVLALPSRSEGTPLVVLEALCRGVPVAASAVGGIPDVIADEGEGLLLRPPARGRALAAAIARLYDDAPFREALARNALARGAGVCTAREIAACACRVIEESAREDGGAASTR